MNSSPFTRIGNVEDLVLSVPRKTLVWPSELRARKARTWIGQLPIADSVQAARQIYRALFHLNRSRLHAEDRLELMELYGAPVASVSESLSVHLDRFALPLSGKKRQLADFLRELHMEMAYGYKAVLQELIARRWRRRDDRLLVALMRAVEYLGLVLSHSYRAYVPYPVGVWREIHGLYAYAEQYGHADRALRPDQPFVTLRTCYQRVLLLALAGPYQLPPKDCARAEAILAGCATRAQVLVRDDTEGREFQFLVDLRSDMPPGWARATWASPSLRVFDVSALVTYMRSAVARLRAGESARAIGFKVEMLDAAVLDLLERLLRFWAAPPTRRHERVKRAGVAQVCTGLKAVHFFLSGQAGVESETRPSAGTLLRRELEDYLDLEEVEATSVRSVPEYFRVLPWFIRDEAAGGLSLVRDGTEAIPIQAGELVAVERERGAWHLGVVRWLKSPDAERLEMGLEVLAERPQAVFLEGVAGREPAILLPRRGDTQLLIARAGVLELARPIRLVSDVQNEVIYPSCIEQRTPSFEMVGFASRSPLLN